LIARTLSDAGVDCQRAIRKIDGSMDGAAGWQTILVGAYQISAYPFGYSASEH
jgi:hypothetical protein